MNTELDWGIAALRCLNTLDKSYVRSDIANHLLDKVLDIRFREDSGDYEDLDREWVDVVNHALVALVTLNKGDIGGNLRDDCRSWMMKAFELFRRKNADYGEAWRDLRRCSITDLVLVKIIRIREIEGSGGSVIASEGVEGNYLDIVNYGLFYLML